MVSFRPNNVRFIYETKYSFVLYFLSECFDCRLNSVFDLVEHNCFLTSIALCPAMCKSQINKNGGFHTVVRQICFKKNQQNQMAAKPETDTGMLRHVCDWKLG